MLQVTCDNFKCFVHAIISKDIVNEILLSWHDMINLGLLPRLWPKPGTVKAVLQVDTLEQIHKDFSDVISDVLPETPMKGPPMKILLKEKVLPVKITKSRPIPLHWQDEAREVVDTLLKW